MILGKVVGTVWATRKDEQLVGMTLQIVQPVDLDYSLKSGFVVAVDSVGAGVGEIVLVAQGSSARQTALTHNKPVDAVITAIVDKLDVSEIADADDVATEELIEV
ncbi:MAG TPA: EutN/CcmL family microcompartment protein [Rhodothermales bacterium]|nr:EutN/CcmL family microcompartment protein [Rhodothermales bacterium]